MVFQYLGRVNTIQRLHDKGEVDKKHKDNIQFVEACKDSTKSFQLSKQSLYFVSLFIHFLVVLPRPQPIAFRWYNGLHPQIDYQLSGLIAFVGLVHDDLSPVPAIVFKGFHSLPACWRISNVARGQGKGHCRCGIRRSHMNFRRPPCSGFTNRLWTVFLTRQSHPGEL